MSFDVAVRTTQQAIATQNTDIDPYEAFGRANMTSHIVGRLLKFNKGDWLDGDKEMNGVKLAANMDELMTGWVKWVDGKPSEQIMGKVADFYVPPTRSELDDNDKSQWELDMQGQPRDPWQKTFYLVLKPVDSDDLFTFTASSDGGRKVVSELTIIYSKGRKQRPTMFPVVELSGGSYMHSNPQIGRVKKPVLNLVGWEPKSNFDAALGAAAEDDVAEEEAKASDTMF